MKVNSKKGSNDDEESYDEVGIFPLLLATTSKPIFHHQIGEKVCIMRFYHSRSLTEIP